MNITIDEFQEVTCGITGEDCYWHDCSSCHIGLKRAEELARHEERMDAIADITDLTDLSKDIKFGSIQGKCNECNTVAKFMNTSVDALCKAMPSGNFKKYELKEEIPDMDCYYPEWKKCQIYNALPFPDYYMYVKDWPLVAVYSDGIYATSP